MREKHSLNSPQSISHRSTATAQAFCMRRKHMHAISHANFGTAVLYISSDVARGLLRPPSATTKTTKTPKSEGGGTVVLTVPPTPTAQTLSCQIARSFVLPCDAPTRTSSTRHKQAKHHHVALVNFQINPGFIRHKLNKKHDANTRTHKKNETTTKRAQNMCCY